MAQKRRPNRSPEEILTQSAQLVAGTINPYEMGLVPEQVDIENFIKFFKEKAEEMLKNKDALLVSIGPAINTDNDGIYSDDMREILDYIEKKMQTKFYFHYGLLLWHCKDDAYANWLPH